MLEKEIRTFKAYYKIEKRDDGAPKISGYAAVFNSDSEDLGGFIERIKPGAFKNAIGSSDARALFNHDSNYILGRQSAGTLVLKEDKTGLYMEIDPPATTFAQDLMVSIRRGDIAEQSFAFTVKSDQWDDLDKDSKTAIRTILEVDRLYDVSPVTYPAFPDTSVAVRGLEAARDTIDKPPFVVLSLSEMFRSFADQIDSGDKEEKFTREFIYEILNRHDKRYTAESTDEFFSILEKHFESIGDPTKADSENSQNAEGEPTQANETEETGEEVVNKIDDILNRTERLI